MTTPTTATEAKAAIDRLKADAAALGERYERERAVPKRTWTDEVRPMILSLSALELRQGEIAFLLRVNRDTVLAVQKANGLTRTRRRRTEES